MFLRSLNLATGIFFLIHKTFKSYTFTLKRYFSKVFTFYFTFIFYKYSNLNEIALPVCRVSFSKETANTVQSTLCILQLNQLTKNHKHNFKIIPCP